MRACLYLRVSTDKQTCENQRRELEEIAASRGWAVVAVYEDLGISGAKGRDKRPGLDRMLKDAVRRKFDVAMVWSVDRLGRSLPDLIGSMQELHNVKVDLFILQSGIDTTTPAGKAMYQMMGVFAEFERAMIRVRVQAGLDRAKAEQAKGPRYDKAGNLKKLIGAQMLPEKVRLEVRKTIEENPEVSNVAIGMTCEVSEATVRRIRKEMAHVD